MADETIPIYNIKVKGQETKAADLWSLRTWINVKERESSLMNLDSARMADTITVSSLQAQFFQGAWIELKALIDESLGLVPQEPEGSQDMGPGENDKIDVQPFEQPQKVAKPLPPKQPAKESDEPEVIDPDEDAMITL